MIDSGTLSANVSFWEQSLNQGNPSDEAYVELTYLNGSNAVLGTSQTASVYSIGSWENVLNNYSIPASTRSITYTMGFVLEQGTNVDSFVDDNSLTISSGNSSSAPEPATWLLGLTGLGIAMALRHRILRPHSTR